MKAQHSHDATDTQKTLAPPQGSVRIAPGEAFGLGALAGEIEVVEGLVWLTRRGDLADHCLSAGEARALLLDENAVVETAPGSAGAVIRWTPRKLGAKGALARPLRALANASAAASRSIGAMALWAQGGPLGPKRLGS